MAPSPELELAAFVLTKSAAFCSAASNPSPRYECVNRRAPFAPTLEIEERRYEYTGIEGPDLRTCKHWVADDVGIHQRVSSILCLQGFIHRYTLRAYTATQRSHRPGSFTGTVPPSGPVPSADDDASGRKVIWNDAPPSSMIPLKPVVLGDEDRSSERLRLA